MKRILLIAIASAAIVSSFAQTGYEAVRNNSTNQTTERYVINSPGNTATTSKSTWRTKDSTYIEWLHSIFRVRYLGSTVPNYLSTDSAGNFSSSPITNIFNPSNYYTTSVSDSRYLQSYTELDPVFSVSAAAGVTSGNISNWNAAYGWGNHASAGYLTTAAAAGLYQPLGSYLTSESDPTVPSYVKSITSTEKGNWNTAYGWGDHAAAGYLRKQDSSTDYITYHNLASRGYLAPSGSASQYIAGNGSYITFPAIPTNTNQLTNGSGFISTELDPVFSVSAAAGVTSGNISNWNAAYGWGNHASAGYLTTAAAAGLYQPLGSYLTSESDPTVPSYVKSITSTEKGNWNTAYGWGNHAAAGYATVTRLADSAAALNARISAKFTIPTGTTGQYLRGDGTPAPFPTLYTPAFTSYEALLTQTGTAAPTASRKDNNFSGVTFTWGRTSAGLYTITANSAVFTAGKTAVLVSEPSTALNRITYTVTSSTVITFNTVVQSVISLILSLTATDAIFNNTLVEIRVYN